MRCVVRIQYDLKTRATAMFGETSWSGSNGIDKLGVDGELVDKGVWRLNNNQGQKSKVWSAIVDKSSKWMTHVRRWDGVVWCPARVVAGGGSADRCCRGVVVVVTCCWPPDPHSSALPSSARSDCSNTTPPHFPATTTATVQYYVNVVVLELK